MSLSSNQKVTQHNVLCGAIVFTPPRPMAAMPAGLQG
jgi:hypothetical protein